MINRKLLLIACLWIMRPAAAQTVVKQGSLYLHTNSKLSIQGKVQNEGSIINKGLISTTGDWVNTAEYHPSGGTIALEGNSPQIFAHGEQSVDVLIIASQAGVTITEDVEIVRALELQKGVVTPQTDVKIVLSEEGVARGGASDAYINGKLYHTGTGSKFFPVGKEGRYAPVTLTQVSGTDPVVGVEFFLHNFGSGEKNNLQLKEYYWDVSPLTGDFTGSPLNFQLPDTEIDWFDVDNIFIAGGASLDEQFRALDKVGVQLEGGNYQLSGNASLNSRFVTLAVLAYQKEHVYIPNVLSPFAPDAEDRTVKIYSNKIEPQGFRWTIWDAWGHVVYTTYSYEQASTVGWQGIHQKKGEVSPGIYKYLLQATLTNGQTFKKTGNIVLYE